MHDVPMQKPLAFTSPSALLAASTQRAPAASMGYYANSADSVPNLIGLNQYAWPSEFDSEATIGDFVHSNAFCTKDSVGRLMPTTAAPSVPVDSVPQMIGLEQYSWPSEYDSQATLGGFVLTNYVAAPTAAPSVPEDSVPQMIGLEQSAWPSEYDAEVTLGGFVHTNYVAAPTAAPSVPADSVPSLVGLNQYSWPSEYDRQATLGGFVITDDAAGAPPALEASASAPMVGKVVPVAAEEAVVEEAAEEEAEVAA
jgi:hypothetical protein